MLATRVLGAQQWEAWNRLYQQAASSLDAREKKIAQVRCMAHERAALAFMSKQPPTSLSIDTQGSSYGLWH